METEALEKKIRKGGDAKYHEKLKQEGKLFVRERINQLCDKNSFVENALFANCLQEDLPADGVVTGLARVDGAPIAVVANDNTVKAGSWGARTVEKIIRIQETARQLKLPIFYLIDSAGARITDQVQMFPGRRGAGRIFYNQATLSGKIPQICLLFGPSAAGGAYIPAFCDVVIMVDKKASMYLGSPRMAEAVIGEKVSLEEMGGAKMHCSVSGCGDFLVASEKEAVEKARAYYKYFSERVSHKVGPKGDSLHNLIPKSPTRTYDMKELIQHIVDKDSMLEIKELYAPEIITGLVRIEGRTVGIVANQPKVKGGVLFVDSADKAARFIQLCDAFEFPLLFLADVPGFMIGSQVEREGIIRAGAKMIYAVSNARVPKICVVVRKAYGAGLYAMAGPAFSSDCVLALPSAQIAVMGPEPAINAVYFNKLQTLSAPDRQKFIEEKTLEYNKDVDIYRLASELIIDHVVEISELREELSKRLAFYTEQPREGADTGILPM